jgi:hypothetical protein
MSATNDGSGSSERIAAAFMAEGRPGPQDEMGVMARAVDMSPLSLEIKTPQYGSGFSEWAIKGYSKEGLAGGKIGAFDYDPETPGEIAHAKANEPGIIRLEDGD